MGNPMVNRHRRKIASLALKLGIEVPNRNTNGHDRPGLQEFLQPRGTATRLEG